MYFIPLVVFVAPAFAAAGATLAYLEGAPQGSKEGPQEAAEKTASQAGNVAANTEIPVI